jgi:hypothetical protein
MSPGNTSVDGSEQFMWTSSCHPWLMAIVDVKEDGLIKAGVMSTLDQPVTIQLGQQYGQVTLTCETCDVNEAHSFQACLPTIRPRSSPTSTPTTLTNATLRALSVNSISDNLVTDRQMAPHRPRNNLGRHLMATREEPEAPSSGSRIGRSNRQGGATGSYGV